MRTSLGHVIGAAFFACFLAASALAQAPAPFDVAMAHYKLGDFTGARAELEKLAQAGDAKAQYNLGVMTREGKGGPKSDADAFGWFRKAAEQGYTLAAYSVGVMYDNGVGVAKNYAEAARWYRVAADKGDANAQYNLGLLYLAGEGVEKDAATAVSWWRKSAEQGDASAQYNMGMAYSRGTGVATDFVYSFYWMLRAEAQGHTAADEVVSRYRAYAGSEELAEVRKLEAARGSLPKDEAARVESTRLETAKTQAARIEAAKAAEAKAILDASAAAAAKPAEVAAAPTPSAPTAPPAASVPWRSKQMQIDIDDLLHTAEVTEGEYMENLTFAMKYETAGDENTSCDFYVKSRGAALRESTAYQKIYNMYGKDLPAKEAAFMSDSAKRARGLASDVYEKGTPVCEAVGKRIY